MIKEMLIGFGGFLLGVIVSCILLAKRNLEIAQKVTDDASKNIKASIEMAKTQYKTSLEEYENGKNDEK